MGKLESDENSTVASSPQPRWQRTELVSGSVRRTLFVLALPVLGEQLLNSFVAIFDTFLAGRISTDATAAVGLAAYIEWLASLIFALVGTGTTALVARCWGTRDYESADRFANQSVSLAAILGVAAYGLIYQLAPGLTSLQNMDGETQRIAVRYLRIDGAGHLFTSVSLVGAAALRGVGDMRSPMLVLAAVNVFNVVVSPLLVFGIGPFPTLGVDGIAVGTLVARTCGGVLMAGVLASGVSGLNLRTATMKLRTEEVRRILRIGVPAGCDGLVLWTGHFLFLMVVARLAEGELGEAYFAAHIIAVRVEAFTYLPAVAWGAAAATMVGQALGAGKPDRAKRVGHEAVLHCSLIGCLAGLTYFFAAAPIYELMHRELIVRDIGIPAMRVLAFFQPLLVVSIVYIRTLQGAGDTRYPLAVTLTSMLLVRLPLGYLCGIVWQGGLIGAWVGMFGDIILRALLATARYASGRWLETKV